MNKTSPIFIIAGEASGDMHGAHLIQALIKEQSQLQFIGMGSTQLANAGAKLIVDSKNLAVVGFIEVLIKLKEIRRAFKKIKQAIDFYQPKMMILIDYPGFNLRLAKAIKKVHPNIKILYYVSPQIWAWRYQRIDLIKKVIDLMAVIFPFEVPIYQKENVPVKFVGHPLVNQVKVTLTPTEQRNFFGLPLQAKVIGLMPGSRQSEIKYLLPTAIKAAELLKKSFPEMEFILPLAPTLTEKDLQPFLNETKLKIKLAKDNHYDAMAMCDALIVASGTATLEIAMLGKPMVIIYKSSSLSFALAKLIVKVNYVGLCNLVADRLIVQELLQGAASPENIAQEINRILTDEPYRSHMIIELQNMSSQLIQAGVTDHLPNIILKILAAIT